MSAFEYEALDASGKKKKGIINADSVAMVREQLKKMHLFPVTINLINDASATTLKRLAKAGHEEKGGFSSLSSIFKKSGEKYRLKASDLSLVTRQLATLLQSGLTIEEAITALIKQAENYSAKAVLQQVLSAVTEGKSLADAMAVNTKSFPEIYIASVAAGEQTGRLGEVFDRLADYTEKRQALKRNISGALVYPIILAVVSIAILVFLLTVIVPKIVVIFEDSGQALPFITQMVISMSDFLVYYGWLLAMVIAALYCFSLIYFKRPEAKFALHKKMLSMPGLKKMIRSINASRMARTLSIMVGSGVPLLTAMQSVKKVVSNVVIQDAVEKAAMEVSEGLSLGHSLERAEVFPPMLVQMVHSGEMSGRLAEMLERAAELTESELESKVSALVKLFEPVMILVMGAMVMVIVLAILLPIFELNQLVG